MKYDDMMKPYKRKLIIEAVIKAVAAGLFCGSLVSLALALFTRFVVKQTQNIVFVVLTVVLGVATAIAIGIRVYQKRFRSNAKRLAKRMEAIQIKLVEKGASCIIQI